MDDFPPEVLRDILLNAMEVTPAMMAIHDRRGERVWVNQTYLRERGERREDVVGTSCHAGWAHDRRGFDCPVRRTLATGEPATAELRIPDPTRRTIPAKVWLSRTTPLRRDGALLGVLETLVDIVEQRRAEEEARESLLNLQLAQRIADIGSWTLDPHVGVPVWSPQIYEIYERDPALGPYHVDDYQRVYRGEHYERFANAIRAAVRDGTPYDIVLKLELPGGRFKWVHAICQPEREVGPAGRYIRGTIQDITERTLAEQAQRRLQAELAHSQRIESIGRLAGGIAHDFNNMLSVIISRVEITQLKLPAAHPAHVNLDAILAAAERSAELTQYLLAFARKQPIAPKLIDINSAIEGMLEMLRRLIGEHIKLLWRAGKGVGAVKLDPTQLHQIVTNIAMNARDAISGQGQLVISTSAQRLTAEDESMQIRVPPGEYVQLSIGDDGSGIEPDALAQIFEPFFTTKQPGAGTGLGLAVVYGIMKQNLGGLKVRTTPGEGTTFSLYFPAHTEPAYMDDPPAADVMTTVSGGESILLVEDEPAILTLATQVLEDAGYTVLANSSPLAALRLAEERSRLDLLITDVVMPEMNGRALYRRVKQRFPTISVLYMSGYTADIIAHHGVLDQGINFLPKPFKASRLVARVREVLKEA